ncbi:MAG TPA: DUF5652 family protein [Candidatus Paceibacterota bacterium]|nr:DUF5652 family protein [Candidatus Paceibacterota bacterium]
MQQQLESQMGVEALAAGFGLTPGVFLAIFLLVSVWSLAIKGYALWHAAREGQRTWYIALLVVNTFGILELAYLLFFRLKDEEEEA